MINNDKCGKWQLPDSTEHLVFKLHLNYNIWIDVWEWIRRTGLTDYIFDDIGKLVGDKKKTETL